MKQSLTRNLAIGFGFSLLILLASSLASYLSIRSLLLSSQWVNHTYGVISKLNEVVMPIQEAETAQRGFLITGDPAYLEPFHGSFEESLAALEKIKSLTVDNQAQQVRTVQLRELINKRFNKLEVLIKTKEESNLIDTKQLLSGKIFMDSIVSKVSEMKNAEQDLLSVRTQKYISFSRFTPVIIILSSLIAIIIAVFFYIRIRKDINLRVQLQQDLQQKDVEISRRIQTVKTIAERISSGDYGTRVNDEEKDNLGSLSAALNKMAASLDYSFKMLADKEWLQTGSALINETIMGEQPVQALTSKSLQALAAYCQCPVGALYLNEGNKTLSFSAGFAFLPGQGKKNILFGEGIVGEAAISQKDILIGETSGSPLQISYATGSLKPAAVYAVPVFFEKKLIAVIELGSLSPFTERDRQFIRNASDIIGIAINTAQNRERLHDLLEELQSQAEELQSQQKELEMINNEMEVQTERLQVSEEELKVQQEELTQTNRELEERNKLLEERNALIAHRNSEIHKKAEELAQSTRYKSEFLANMSHELRTPLNSILLLSRLLAENKDKSLSKDQVEYAQVIQSSGNGLLELIDEILDLSKIESGKMELDYSFLSLSQLIADMKMVFEPVAREKGVLLSFETDPETTSDIETDRMRLEQILKNLLSNAFKFTTAGSVTLRMKPGMNSGSRSIVFEVADTGIGIPDDKQELIFEAFQQADGSTKRKYGGTGLGLSISRELSRLLQGELSVKSTAGEGSVFALSIPVRKKSDEEHVAIPKKTISGKVPEPVRNSAHDRLTLSEVPKSIPDDRNNIVSGDRILLIIEDDTHFASALLNYTRSQHYKGIVAVEGDEGIRLAKSYFPTGILLDIQLPMRNGWEVMDELKKDPSTRHIPIHVMSSFEAKKESITRGAIDFINKPVAYEQMADIFKKIESVVKDDNSKVLIIEENPKHAQALSYYLSSFQVQSSITQTVPESIEALRKDGVQCVILDMGLPEIRNYDRLESIKSTPGFEHIPIIVFTGKNFSRTEEQRIRQFADSIVIKTAHSYQRILDEVSIFLHIMDQRIKNTPDSGTLKLGSLDEVLKDKIVLMADDDVRNIFSLTKILENHKMKILPAVDGNEALSAIQAKPRVDIVLMDMMMPEMDGFDTIRRIREMPSFKDLPIIAVTAKAMSGDREKCIEAGASDYISKPVDVDQLISLLRIWLYEK